MPEIVEKRYPLAIPSGAMLYIIAIAIVVCAYWFCQGKCSSPPCTCPGGTPQTGQACVRAQQSTGYVAACAQCPRGFEMNNTSTACVEKSTMLLEGPSVPPPCAPAADPGQDPCSAKDSDGNLVYPTPHTCNFSNARDGELVWQPQCRWSYTGECATAMLWSALGIFILATMCCFIGMCFTKKVEVGE